MVQPGRDSPGKEVKGTSPSPSPKWVFRPTNAKRNMKKSATPHPIKTGGNTKRSACVPLTETGRVRKKIVFEFDELIAGTNGGGSAIAGKDGWSSLPGEREKGRWKRKARPGPFEASTGAFEVVPGVLPLLAGELRFSMGQKDGSARHQPEVVTGTRLEGALPEVNEAVAQGLLRSTRMEAAASAAVLDEDTSSERYGANMLFDPPTLAAPFPEKDRHDNNGGGEAGLNGKPSAPDNPSDPPDKLLDQDRDQPEILPKHSTSEVGIDVASPVGSPPTLGHSLEFITDKAAQAETQPVEPDLDEKPANTGAGLDSGGPPKSDAVNLDADHDTEMGTFGWCEGIPSLTFSNEETKCLVDKHGLDRTIICHRFHNASAEILLLLGLRVPEPRILRHVADHHPLLLRGHLRGLAHHPLMKTTPSAAALPPGHRLLHRGREHRPPERARAPTRDEAEQHGVPAQHRLAPDGVSLAGGRVVGGGGGGGGGRRGEGVGVEVELGAGADAALLRLLVLDFLLLLLLGSFFGGDASRSDLFPGVGIAEHCRIVGGAASQCSRQELTPVDPGVCRLSISDFNSPPGVRRKRTLLSRLCSVAAGKSFCWLRHLQQPSSRAAASVGIASPLLRRRSIQPGDAAAGRSRCSHCSTPKHHRHRCWIVAALLQPLRQPLSSPLNGVVPYFSLNFVFFS
ncbi:hypothetical protein SASPL_108674 [Salvia splendens]|uniref:Uncharacterized protein n=1 Tax=Salvia splendens TaxID=180675 RepID=A0A8X9A8F2_SALSN|nr:hypothetical protein SASPL_108674 [Salvia splendens]